MSRYNRKNFLIARIAHNNSGYSLGLLVNPRSTVATDGHMIIQVMAAKTGEGRELKGPVNLEREMALEIARSIPMHTTVEMRGDSRKSIAIKNRHFTVIQIQDKNYNPPFLNYRSDKIFPANEPRARIIINARLLLQLAKIIASFTDMISAVEIEVRKNNEVVLFYTKTRDGQTVRCALMSMRDDGEYFAEIHKTEWD